MSELQTLSEEHVGEEAANNYWKKFSTTFSKLNQTDAGLQFLTLSCGDLD